MSDDPTLSMKVASMNVEDLKPHPNNPRRGNIKAVKESLAANGQFKPILIQKATNVIIAGNHTWKAAKDLGWKKIKAIALDVDDEGAKRIMLADNRTSDLGTYDTEALAELLKSIEDPQIGTGYDEDAVANLLGAIAEENNEVLQDVIRPPVELVSGAPDTIEERDEPEFVEGPAPEISGDGTTFEPTEEVVDEDAPDDFDKALGQLQGSMALKARMDLDGKGYYGIPELRSDMLLDSLPQPFDTWAGKEATPDDGITHWLWNYGVSNATGLPFDRATVCFYTFDEKFESWWDMPDFYVAKMLNSGLKSAVVPDFSLYSIDPVALHIYNVYRAQWLGRYFQECGLKVIPRLQFYNDQSLDFALTGIPKGCPLLIHSAQNLKSRGPGKPLTDVEKGAARTINLALEKVQPQTFIVYGGPPAHRLVESGHISDKHVGSGGIVSLKNFAWKRRGVVFDKKEGLGSQAKSKAYVKEHGGAKGGIEVPDDERELEEWGE